MDIWYLLFLFICFLCHGFHFFLSEGLIEFGEEVDLGVSFNDGHSESDCVLFLPVLRSVNVST
jgi:cbb3-type cytochrome oxidase subunit 3